MRILAIVCAVLMAAGPSVAQERETIGIGRLFTNDYFGDNQDRWRSGSYALSVLRGPEWFGERPARAGSVLEYRLRSEIIAPQRLNGPLSGDRAYVGALSAGVHTHFSNNGADVSVGLDVVAVGPQTGLSDLQGWFHDLVNAPSVGAAVEANQVENAFYPTALVELAYPVQLSQSAQIRPFVEAQYGVEDLVRIGADVILGQVGHNDLWLRDSASGQLYSGAEGAGVGYSFVFGMDYAVVGNSAYFPASFGTVAQDERLRARAGVHSRFGDEISVFYGATYLSEEYVGQPEGQIVGSLKLIFTF